MISSNPRSSERRRAILEAATRVLSQHGLRGLTHRAVDREAGVPQGTTSYHASTRQALLELVVEQLVTRSEVLIEAGKTMSELAERFDASMTIDEFLDPMSDIIDDLSSRVDSLRARYALLIDLEPGQLRTALTAESLASQELVPAIAKSFANLGVAHPEQQARDLVEISDALIWQRTIMGHSTDIRAILKRYLSGVLRA